MTATGFDWKAEQRAAALARGNEVRYFRADLKRDIAAGKVRVTEVLNVPVLDRRLESMLVVDLMQAVPGVGPSRVARILSHLDMSPSIRLAVLTRARRVALASQLEWARR